jgi:hypothetical protein
MPNRTHFAESRYARVLRLLQDGNWHEEDELGQVVAYPWAWIRELRLDGKPVEVKKNCRLAVRLQPV